MKDYKRLTKWSELGTLHVFDINGKEIPLCDVSPIDADNLAGRLAELEDKIESGEIDYVADSKTEQTITDLLIEFDEMGFAPTTVCPNAEQYAIDWRERVRKEFARLAAENKRLKEEAAEQKSIADHEHATQMEWFSIACDYKAEAAALQKRLDNVVELPRIIHPNPREWHIQYKYESGIITSDIRYSESAAEARLAELKGEQK